MDAAFSYKYNQQLGVCTKDGLAISPGFTTTHVVPVSFNHCNHLRYDGSGGFFAFCTVDKVTTVK